MCWPTLTAPFLTEAPGRNALAEVVVAKAKTIKDWMRNMVDDQCFYAARSECLVLNKGVVEWWCSAIGRTGRIKM